MNYQPDDKLDVQYIDSEGGKYWYTASIIDVKSDQIEIHYICDGDNHKDDEWIDKASDRLSLLNAHTFKITHLPSIVAGAGSNVMYYQHNNKQYILLCAHYTQTIYRYDMNAAKWEEYTNYPETFSDRNAGNIAFDEKRLILYIAGVHEGYITMAALDIASKSWTVQTFPEIKKYASYREKADLFFIPEPIQETHLFFQGMIYQIIDDEIESEKFKLKQTDHENFPFTDTPFESNEVIWYDNMKRVVTAYDGYIYYCDIIERMQNKYIWKRVNDEKMDGVHSECHLILVYENILFVINNMFSKIFCVDLLYGITYKVFKEIPAILNHDSLVIKANDNYLHIIDVYQNQVHIKISLLEMIPQQLNDYYARNICNPLVFGYIAEMTKHEELSVSIPFDIAKLILRFLPCFL